MSRLKSYLFAPAALLCAVALPLPLLAARTVAMPSLHPGELPNSEVVTNIALGASLERLDWISFSLALDASESNSLSIAVGAAYGDVLTLEETDFEWGYDCGKWFYADTARGAVEEWPSAESGRVERTLTINHRDFNSQWNRIRIVKRGIGDMHVVAVQTNEFKKFSINLR